MARCLTTQAQRPSIREVVQRDCCSNCARDATIATGARWPGSSGLVCARSLGFATGETFASGKFFSGLPKPFETLQRMVRHQSAGIKITRLASAHNIKMTSSTLLALEKPEPTVCLCLPVNHSPTEPSNAGGAKRIAAPCNAHIGPVPQNLAFGP